MIYKYVFAGAPSGGKTKGIEYLQKKLYLKGYKVYSIQETATELIKAGVDRDNQQFPYYNYSLMLYKELLLEKNAINNNENAVILCDRGRMDAKAYRGEKVFNTILEQYPGTTEESVLNSYDGVIFLQTVADSGNAQEYCQDEIRIESAEMARELQSSLFEVWKKHKKLIYIPFYKNFEEKLKRLEFEIVSDIEKRENQKLTLDEFINYVDKLDISKDKMLEEVESVICSINPQLLKETLAKEYLER